MNSRLRHVTVLEEAHNLLRKTSAEQSQEGANLQGKSVEMLANAIAEMRTYGEGFIIADQAPGLLDMSVIRNTNTKIILRLPDEEDRKLVGKSAALKEAQIDELSKLPLGVAAVYQNEWPEAVLCKIEAYPMPENAVSGTYLRPFSGSVSSAGTFGYTEWDPAPPASSEKAPPCHSSAVPSDIFYTPDGLQGSAGPSGHAATAARKAAVFQAPQVRLGKKSI